MLRLGPVVVGGTTTSGGFVKTTVLKILTWMGWVKEPIQIEDVVEAAVPIVSTIGEYVTPDELELIGQHPSVVLFKLLCSRYGVLLVCNVVRMALPYRSARVFAELQGPSAGVMVVESETRTTASLRCGAALVGMMAANWSRNMMGPEGTSAQHCAVLDGLQVVDELSSYYHGRYHEEVGVVRKLLPRLYQAYGLLSIAHSTKTIVDMAVHRGEGCVSKVIRATLALGLLGYKLWSNWAWQSEEQSVEHEAAE